MSFFAVLFALLLEQLKPLPRDNWVHETLARWVRWTDRNFDAGESHHVKVVWLVSVLVPTALSAGVYLGLHHYSLVLAFAFNVLMLYLTLGFRQFSHYYTDIREALDRGDEAEARRLLGEWRHLDTSELPRTDMCLASFSGLWCFQRWVWGRWARCSTAWPNSVRVTGPTATRPWTRR